MLSSTGHSCSSYTSVVISNAAYFRMYSNGVRPSAAAFSGSPGTPFSKMYR